MSQLLLGVGGGVAVVVGAGASNVLPLNAWSGFVSPTTATVSHRLDGEASARLVVSISSDLSNPVYSSAVATDTRSVRHTITGLSPDTAYHYAIEVGGVLRQGMQGRFRTLPSSGAASFRFGASGCSDLPTSDVAAWLLSGANLDFFIHHGDLHYGDINSTDASLYDARLDTALSSDLGALLKNVATFYMWDDHDFCGDNSSSASAGRDTAVGVGRRRFPVAAANRWLSGALDPLGYSFTVGRVRFLVPDQRSGKVTGGTVWGAAQQAALFAEITAAKNAQQVLVIVSTYTTSGTEFPAAQRTLLWDHIKAQGMQASTLFISGDAHMVAFDDGTNHNFATGGGAPIPHFVANPLSRATSIKGGPWSGGDYRVSANQAGVIDVTDTGGASIAFALMGYRDAGVLMATFNVSLTVPVASDTVAPTLSAATDAANGSGAMTGGVSTNEANGTLYYFVSTSSTSPTAAALKAGTGAAAFGNQPVTATGAQNISASGLAASTAYFTYYLHADAAGNDSAVVAADGFTTAAASGGPPAIVQRTSSGRTTTGTSASVTLPSPVTAGNLIVLGVFPDKASGAFTTPAGFTPFGHVDTTQQISGALFYKIAAGGEQTFTGTWTTAQYGEILAIEIAGASASNPIGSTGFNQVDDVSTSRGTTASAPATGSADELGLAIWHMDSTSSVAGAETWTGMTAEYSSTTATTSGPTIRLGKTLYAAAGSTPSATFAYAAGSADQNAMWLFTVRKA